MPARLKIGTRGSRLALIQTEMVRDALTQRWGGAIGSVDLVGVSTAGDRDRSRAIEDIGGRGVFTAELDDAVLSGTVDLAVHSVKDLPAVLDRGLALAATLEREDPREAFVSAQYARIDDLPAGAVFGSASIRRQALLRRLRPDAHCALLRGNVEERVAAIDTGVHAGTILAVAGLKRLGLANRISQILEPHELMPDPGQGAIGIVCRANDARTRFLLNRINHAPTRVAIAAERAFLAAAGSHAIVGALARFEGGRLALSGVAVGSDRCADRMDRVEGDPDAPEALGHLLASRLLRKSIAAKAVP